MTSSQERPFYVYTAETNLDMGADIRKEEPPDEAWKSIIDMSNLQIEKHNESQVSEKPAQVTLSSNNETQNRLFNRLGAVKQTAAVYDVNAST